MAKQQTDEELNLRRKARRRLIGAIALTLAVVVILPMVLDSEPKPTGNDIDLRIPPSDKVGEFVPGIATSEVAGTLPLAASSVAAAPLPVAASAVAQTNSAKPVAAPISQPSVASSPRTEVQGKIQPATNKQPEAKAPEFKASEPKTPEAKAAEPKKTEPKTSEPKTSESKAPESKTQDKSGSVESYVAQVGAYSNAATAKQELDKLKKWGFNKAYTEKAGDKIRVRVGPYTERDKVEKVRHLLEKHGLHPVVTNEK